MPTRVMDKTRVGGGGCVNGEEIYSGDQRFLMGKKVFFEDCSGVRKEDVSCSDESSSIGKNSDLSDENSLEKSRDGEEVQSSFKGPLDAMESLEEVLPIRRGISRFYNGKSKSFASLADASTSSTIKDIVKPENAYMRKRRNLLAYSLTSPRSSPLRGSISKRVPGRTSLALAVAMTSSEFSDLSPRRSFSLADLQQCASVAISCSNSDKLAQ